MQTGSVLGKPDRRRKLGIPSRRWNENIEMQYQEKEIDEACRTYVKVTSFMQEFGIETLQNMNTTITTITTRTHNDNTHLQPQ